MLVELNEDEMACILVGLSEFDFVTDKEVFKPYGKINRELIEKFRVLNWKMIEDRRKRV
jgi:hypothetical protein